MGGSYKKFHAKSLIAIHFMIMSLFKIVLDCSSLIINFRYLRTLSPSFEYLYSSLE